MANKFNAGDTVRLTFTDSKELQQYISKEFVLNEVCKMYTDEDWSLLPPIFITFGDNNEYTDEVIWAAKHMELVRR